MADPTGTTSAAPTSAAPSASAEAIAPKLLFEDSTDLEVLREVMRLAEKFIDSQLIAIGALAQRASALAGMFGAGSFAMLAVELSFLNVLQGKLDVSSYLLALIAPAFMFLGCVLCGFAAGTSQFSFAGNKPKGWSGNFKKEDIPAALAGEMTNYQTYIDRNEKIIARHAQFYRWGQRLGFLSPIVLVAVGGIYLGWRQ